jgi:co-chaperonin GroES (HSP10)
MTYPRLLSDRVLIRETPPGELRIGSIILPNMKDDARGFSKHQERALCIGTVIAVGPGERIQVYECDACGTRKSVLVDEGRTKGTGFCGQCDGTKFFLVCDAHTPMHVQPGDEVVYPHRAALPVPIPGAPAGESYLIVHEEQFVYGVIED